MSIKEADQNIPKNISTDAEEAEVNIEQIVEENLYTGGHTQWSIQGDNFYATYSTVPELPSGFYEMGYDTTLGQFYLKKKRLITEEIFKLPDDNFESIIEDIKKFWDSKDLYKKYGYVYKRGILLYGPPGCGKTSLINLLCDDLIYNQEGIVINISEPDHIYDIHKVLTPLREIEPDRKIIMIFEDIDNFTKEKTILTKLLNILDGNGKMDNVVNIATTNYPEELEERISNRPSRFDRRYEIGIPNYKIREFYIKNKMDKKDFKGIDVQRWLKSTEGFTLDHLKELILSYAVLGYEFEIALNEMKNMIKNGTLRASRIPGSRKIGPTIGKK